MNHTINNLPEDLQESITLIQMRMTEFVTNHKELSFRLSHADRSNTVENFVFESSCKEFAAQFHVLLSHALVVHHSIRDREDIADLEAIQLVREIIFGIVKETLRSLLNAKPAPLAFNEIALIADRFARIMEHTDESAIDQQRIRFAF